MNPTNTGSWSASRNAWLSANSGWELTGQKPLSTLLKLATAQAHVDVLRPPIVNKLITGRIPLRTHILYLMMLHDVYDNLETGLARHADHPLLAATFDPSTLARTQSIAQDITYLLDLPSGADWEAHDLAQSYRASPPSVLSSYIERIRSLSEEDDTVPMQSSSFVFPPPPASAFLLLSHAYVRYMGDLNGGQQIKEAVAKAYHFDGSQQDGLRFYRFDGGNGEAASAAELGKITAQFRKGMDSIGEGLTAEQRAALLQEANYAFELNILLFSSFTEDGNLLVVGRANGSDSSTPKARFNLSVLDTPGSATPHIPSPSLEGYAKAANYMPAKRAEQIKRAQKESQDQRLQTRSRSPAIPKWLVLALAVPVVLLARTLLQRITA